MPTKEPLPLNHPMATEAAPGKVQHQAGSPAVVHGGSCAPSVPNKPDRRASSLPASVHCSPEHLPGAKRTQELLSLEALLPPKRPGGSSSRDSANEAEGLSGVSWC